MSNYQIEKLTKSNLSFIYELYTKVHGKKRPPFFYENKYNTDYVGVEAFAYSALYEGNAIGFVGIIPTVMSIAGETIIGAQLVDAMVDSKHRNKGVIVSLLKKLLVDAKNNSTQLIFVFPNQNSFHLTVNKLGFKQLHTMNSYVIKNDDNIFKKWRRTVLNLKLQSNQTSIENNLLKLGYDGVIYNDDYLNYKKYNQHLIFENTDYTVWISDIKRAWLGAINMNDKTNIRTILDFVSKKYSSKSFTYLVSPNNELDTLFSKITPAKAGFPVCVYDFTGELDLSRLTFQFADVDVF